jgi:hypothetical protein
MVPVLLLLLLLLGLLGLLLLLGPIWDYHQCLHPLRGAWG